MNSKYTGKLVEYLLDKISSLSSGDVGDFIGTGLLDKFLRKDLDERTPHSLASDKKLEVGNFVSGTAGAVIYIDELTKHSVAEIDKLYVRLKAYFEQLEIINVNSVGGKLIISPAGGIKCSLVETYDSWGYYRCYFLSEQDGEKIENRFAVGDLAYSKTFNAREGSYNKISNRYYWRLVVGRGENYIDLSKTDCDADSDEPQEGDVIVHRGNRNDVDRLNCLEFSSVDSFSPSITLYQGINDYSLADKNIIQFGVEKSTGKAFMNVYGDMFIGNRDNSSYIRYSPEKGVEIKGKLDIGTSFGDKTLLDAIDLASTAYEEDLNNLKDIVNRDILNILNLLDGAIETWFYDPAPTLTNLPASLWTTEADKNVHLGDLYYSGAGRAYRFLYDADNSLYYWQEIVDTDIVLALENAKKAQDTADSKRKIFARKPENSDSYDIGDMWVNANYTDNNVTYKDDLLRAIVTKNAGELFKIEHWTLASKYTDDTVAKDALEKATNAQLTVNTLLSDVTSFKGYVDGAFLDGIIDSSEAQAIEKYINQLNTIKQQVDKSYEEIIKNSILENTTYLTNLNDSYSAFSTSYNELIDTINAAISDNKTTDLEKSAVDSKYSTFNDKYRDYTAYLNLAINYIEETINGKVERALLDIGGYKYLKAALLENTSIEGGLIQSSMLSLGYTKNNLFLVMAGTNGLVLDKGDRTIASWFGGGMIDMFDYYDSNTKTFNIPEDVRAAAGLDRMDGTGYRAKGNLWWDETGVIHADPLSFFVGEATVGGLLASFLVVMKEDGKHPLYLIPQVPFLSLEIADYIRIGDALLKYDSTSKAIYVTSADGTTSMGFYASGYVSALGKNSSGGSTGSASALYQLADIMPNSTNDGVLNAANGSVLMYNGSKWQAGNVVTDISPLTLKVNGSNLFTYDGKSSITANLTVPTKVSQLTNDTGFITGISSSMVTSALGYTPYNSTNPNGYISGITKAMVEGVLTGNITSHTHSYLPLSGGTLTGLTYFNINNAWLTPSVLQIGRIDESKDAAKAVIGVTNGNLHIDAYHGKMLCLNYYNNGQIRFGYQTGSYYISEDGSYYSGNAATASKWATARTLSLTGSVTGSVSFDGSGNATLTTSTNHTHSYLPLSGGTMTNSASINWAAQNGKSAYIGQYTSDGSLLISIEGKGTEYGLVLGGTNGNLLYKGYRVLDASNYNSYVPTKTGTGASGTWEINISGNAATATNADMIDGLHADSFTRMYSLGITTDDKVNYILFGKAYVGTAVTGFSFSGTVVLKRGSSYAYNSLTNIVINIAAQYMNNIGSFYYVGSFSGLRIVALVYNNETWLALEIPRNSSMEVYLYGRKLNNCSFGLTTAASVSDVRVIVESPSINAIASSATKLQTARTIWGQSFDGTANVSGALTGVTDLTASRQVTFSYRMFIGGGLQIGYWDGANNRIENINRPLLITSYEQPIGIGFNGDNSSIYIPTTGNVGIGTTSPEYKLHISSDSVGDALKLQSSQSYTCIIYQHSGSYAWAVGANTSNYFYFFNNYKLRTVARVDINGNFSSIGAVTAKASSSDIRLKTDITDYKALSIIRNHRSIKYHWNEAAKANADIFNDDDWHYGLIAQEMQKDMPQMVSDVFKDYLVINYERLIPICWKGLQEVDDEVTRLKKKVRKLEMEIRELKQERR